MSKRKTRGDRRNLSEAWWTPPEGRGMLSLKSMMEEARDLRTSWDRLWQLFDCKDRQVHLAILDNPNVVYVSPEGNLNISLLEMLARKYSDEVSRHPTFVLHAIVTPSDAMSRVVQKVVQEISDGALISRLVSQYREFPMVRLGATSNKNAPETMLRALGNEQNEKNKLVRIRVACNPNTPGEVLQLLANPSTESSLNVRSAALKALSQRGLA